MESLAELVADLNPAQREAVEYSGGPLLVMAGAGSGKTRVLTRRISYLLATGQAKPENILAITFTNKAAAEMRERIEKQLGSVSRNMWIGTFHATCVRLLRLYGADTLGIKSGFSIYDQSDAKHLVKLVLEELNLSPKTYDPRALLQKISALKNALVSPEDYATHPDPGLVGQVQAKVYKRYQKRLLEANAMDFDDLIRYTVVMLKDFPNLQWEIARRFRYILVDEYQDTNHAQYVLVKMLCGLRVAHYNDFSIDALETGGGLPADFTPSQLSVVGDSDQSIYAFRGATVRNIEEFEKDFPGAHVVTLDQNYRSTKHILQAANGVISQADSKYRKQLWTEGESGSKLELIHAEEESIEAYRIVARIDEFLRAGYKYSDIAIFFRVNSMTQKLEEVFPQSGIPYRIVGGMKFYDRKEIKDILAYLQLLINPSDEVALMRVINTPRRGLGGKALETLSVNARHLGVSVGQLVAKIWLSAQDNFGSEKAGNTDTDISDELGQSSDLPADPWVNSEVEDVLGILSGKDDELLEELLGKRTLPPIPGYDLEILAQLPDITGLSKRAEKSLLNFWDLLTKARGFLHERMPLGKIVEYLLEESGYLEMLRLSKDVTDRTRLDYLGEFCNVANAHGESNPDANLDDFLEKIALVADSDQLPDDDSGEVTLMTVHTAKGLEYPIVFICGMEEELFPHSRSIDNPLELSEERRLAYVAITRAREHLVFSGVKYRWVWGKTMPRKLSRYLFEIDPELFSDPDLLTQAKTMASRYEDYGITGGNYGNNLPRKNSRKYTWENHFRMEEWDKSSPNSVNTATVPSQASHQPDSYTNSYSRQESYPDEENMLFSQADSEYSRPRLKNSLDKLGAPRFKAKDVDNPALLLELGDRVEHTRFGLGEIVEIYGSGRNRSALVEFDSGISKKLLLRLAPITKIEE